VAVVLESIPERQRKQKHRGNNMDTVSFSFSVPGKPQQKGSKQAFARMGKNGRPFATLVDSNKEAMNHQNWIKACALAEVPLDWERDGPIKVSIYFQFERPKSHILKSGELRKGAPEHHVSKPDIDKLVRTVLDGLTGVLFADDSQVGTLLSWKGYGNESRTDITITRDTDLG
jgi:Holliday junction resolvase RusA-like endonuclease